MTVRSYLKLIIVSACALTCGLAMPAFGQSTGGFSQLDVQQPDATASLNASLARLGDNPRDVTALIGAGEAALSLNDPNAATGFFARADEIQSGNGRIKAGLGRAMLQLQKPGEALRLFDQAERLRYPADSFLADRGLARDLTGDQAGAQSDYQTALRTKPNDPEIVRRYAVSLGISGQVDASEKVIEPLLYKNDRAAWRNRAFVLAMNGRDQQARNITQKVMPKPLATAIQPYMDRMAGLTPAQRAAAVHFGNFPSNAGVRVASNSAPPPRAVQPFTRAAPVPQQPSAAVGPPSTVRPAPQPVTSTAVVPTPSAPIIRNVAPAGPTGAVAVSPSSPVTGRSVVGSIVPGPAVPAAQTPSRAPVPAPVQAAPIRPTTAVPAPVQGPVDTAPFTAPQSAPVRQPAPTAQQPVVAASPQAAPPAAPNPVATRTLADIIRELNVPEAETRTQVAAVDLSEIVAFQERKRLAAKAAAERTKRYAAAKLKMEADAKAKAAAAEKAKLAKNPSRNWVQVGTGQSVSALGFTLRALRKKHDSLASKDAFTAPWGRTNRLVVGPFPSFAKAKDFEAAIEKVGADAFSWKSEAGEEVVPLPGG